MTSHARTMGTGGLDHEQVRQVFVSIGRPLPRRAHALADLVSAVRLVPRRTLMLMVLLGLSVLLALTARAEPVQKGQGGVGQAADIPLREIENFPEPVGPTLYNFLQIPMEPAIPASPRPGPARDRRVPPPSEPTKLLTALALIALVILWIHLRSTRVEHPAPPRRRVR